MGEAYIDFAASSTQFSRNNNGSTRDSLILAARWLKECRNSHWKCTDPKKSFMPTRVVSISNNALYVCLGENIRKPTEYATLSHCWGEMTFVTLSSNNIGLFQTQIPPEALSQTVMDAVEIARRLGFSYIWIDTLCIIQDDPDDWKRESSIMGAVYGGSSLNIAASGAHDGNDGCFFDRPQHWRCQAEVKIDGSAQLHDFVSSSFNYTRLSEMPLMRRGWVLQERLLAPRTLHFTTTELFWECHQKSACESFPEELPWPCTISNDTFLKQPLAASMWNWIVEQYSSCQLTFATDKLIAISGLARRIQEQTKDHYVAGMWRDTLEFQLCWYALKPSPPREAGQYIAPTWSWASVDSTVRIPKFGRFNEAKQDTFLQISILTVNLRNSGPDQFGLISEGVLHVSCTLLLNVRICKHSLVEYSMILKHEMIGCSIYLDQEDTYNDISEDGEIGAHALPLYRNTRSGKIIGLLIKPTRQAKGVYRRIGQFKFWDEKQSDSFSAAATSYPRAVEIDDCYEVRPDKLGDPYYIIHLI